MDNKKIGLFIAEKRKEKKLTQKELAEKLYISDKAISKWERGLSMPDIGLIEKLSNILGISINEILKGEEIMTINKKESDEVLKESVSFFQKKYFSKIIRKIVSFLLIILILGYLLILTLGEYNYGEYAIKIGDNYGYIDLPSFSDKVTQMRTKSFMKYLKNLNYIKIEDTLITNEDHYIFEGSEISREYKEILDNKAKDIIEYNENLKALQKSGFKLLRYEFAFSYYNGSEYINTYDLELEYNKERYEMTLDLTTKNKWVIIKGYGYNSPGKFKNKYTIADLRKQDYNLYKKLEKVFLY